MKTPSAEHDAPADLPDFGGVEPSPDHPMDVFLVRVEGGRTIFYSEGLETRAETGETPDRGVRAWLERSYQRLRDGLDWPQGHVGRLARRLEAWLRGFVSPDEPMLRRLRAAPSTRLHHPPSMASKEARSDWERYLVERRRHHSAWLAVNLAIFPFSVLLTPIPGPNVFGYWFAFRAVCHALAVLGIYRERRRSESILLQPTDALDVPLVEPDGGQAASVGVRLGLKGLDDYLKRVEAVGKRPDGAS